MSRPKLTLAMIVRDEEENLVHCLDSVRAHVDELVVVDTGSVDRTREVAISYGANLYQFDPQNHPEAFFRDTEEECLKFNAPGPFSGMWCLGDFAAARNESFDRATGDYIVWMDADDVLTGAENLPIVVDHLHKNNLPMAFLAYNYAQDHLGRVHYRQWRERVIRRGAARWINPVHEVLMPASPIGPPENFSTPVYQHRRKHDRVQVPNRNYKILLRQAMLLKRDNQGAKLDPRILFYLGQEARYVQPRLAIGFYEEYLQRSGWPEERAAAHMAIGSLLESGVIGLPFEEAVAQAAREYATAAAEEPGSPDGLFGLARIAYQRQRWADCCRYTEAGLRIGNPDSMLGTHPMDRAYRPHIFYNWALKNMGRVEEALRSCELALQAMPDDPGIPGGASGMLTLNAKVFAEHLAQVKREGMTVQQQTQQPQPMKQEGFFNLSEDVDAPPSPAVNEAALVICAMQVWKQIVVTGDGDKARAFLGSLPSNVAVHPVVQRMRESTTRRFGSELAMLTPLHKASGEALKQIAELTGAQEGLDIVLYLGAGPEKWDPNTPRTKGIGGSETAAIEMAKHLAALGHRVMVFAEAMGTFDGVEYRHHSVFQGVSCDVFIASRAPWAVEAFGPVNAKLKLLWVHDIHCGPPSESMERALWKFDRVLCLSEWHKRFFVSCYPTLHEDRVIVTRNGIEPLRFQGPRSKKRNSLVFSSSPNRGLEHLLYQFNNAIRPVVPDAELHIYYGFDTWETMARARGDQAELAEIERYKALLPPVGGSAGGIFNHGKRPQHELAEAYMEAKVWPYLTAFPETSCITAMEAMAAGCVPVCSSFAALAETVKHGVLIPNDGTEQQPIFNTRAWLDNVLRLLKDDAHRVPIAEAAREYALNNLSWAAVAEEWSAMFDVLLEKVAADPAPMWASR